MVSARIEAPVRIDLFMAVISEIRERSRVPVDEDPGGPE
jgi:hypothetical protein